MVLVYCNNKDRETITTTTVVVVETIAEKEIDESESSESSEGSLYSLDLNTGEIESEEEKNLIGFELLKKIIKNLKNSNYQLKKDYSNLSNLFNDFKNQQIQTNKDDKEIIESLRKKISESSETNSNLSEELNRTKVELKSHEPVLKELQKSNSKNKLKSEN